MTQHHDGSPSADAAPNMYQVRVPRVWRPARVRAVIGALLGAGMVITFWSLTGSARRQRLAVRTVQLTRITVDDAMALLTPYITTEGGAVFRAGSGVAAITIREKQERMDGLVRILREYDHPPSSVTLSLKSLTSNDRHGLAAELTPLAAILAPFAEGGGLRVASSGIVTGSEGQTTTTQLGSGPSAAVVTVEIVSTQVLDSAFAVRLRVSAGRPGESDSLLRTDVTVPLGRSLVLGTAMTDTVAPRPLLLLTPMRIER
jgi:hypothetical protein